MRGVRSFMLLNGRKKMNNFEKNMFQPTLLTFNKNRITSKRPENNRVSSWGTMHLLIYLAILSDLESGKLSPYQEIYFSEEAAKEQATLRSTQGYAGERRFLCDVLNQAISLNAPDCIIALNDVYGGVAGTLRRVSEFWYVSNYSKLAATGRKKFPQLSNLYDYYKIGEAFLKLSETSFSFIENRDHYIHGKWYRAQSPLDGKNNVIASIYWGTNQNECLMFYKKAGVLTCSLVINGKDYLHSTGMALDMVQLSKEFSIENETFDSQKEWLDQTFEGYFLNEALAEKVVIEHTVFDPNPIKRRNWENVAYISLSAKDYKAMVPSTDRKFHGNEMILRYKLEEELSVIITDEPIPALKNKIPQYIVPNSLLFAYQYATYRMENYHGKFCAVTGSAGKSSTRLILSHLLRKKRKVFENFGNANLHYPTLGLSLEIHDHYDFILFEAAVGAMNRLGYGNNAYFWQTDVVIMTSFGSAHANGGIERNLMVKEQLFHSVKEGGYVVINKDIEEQYLSKIIKRAESLNLNTLFSSLTDTTADCYVIDKKVLKEKTEITASFRGREICFSLTTDSNGQIQNAMNALLAIDSMGYPAEEYAELLESFQSFEKILRPNELIIDSKKITVIDDTHNSSIESMMNGIDHFTSKKPFYQGEKLLVLGEVADLGNDAAVHHERLIPNINRANPDQVILYGEPFKDLELDVKQVTWCETIEQVTETIIEKSSEDSLVFVKGSHGIGFYKVVEQLKKLSETT